MSLLKCENKLECTKRLEGLTQVDTVKWTLSNFGSLLMSNRGQLLVSCSNTEVGGKEHLKYNLKIRCNPWDLNRQIRVYFQSYQKVMVPTAMIYKCESDIANQQNGGLFGNHNQQNGLFGNHNQQNSVFGSPKNSFAAWVPTQEYRIAEPYKWHFLISEYNKNNFVTLVLQFEFRTYNVDNMNEIQGVFSWVDFGKLLGNELLSDVVIKSTEGEEFKAHKVFLAFRSSILEKKSETKLNEHTTDVDVVEALYSSKVVKEVLKFIYTNHADLNVMTDFYELLDAAENYHIEGLKELCQVTLCEKLTVTNAIQSLELALKHDLKNLEIVVLQFSKDNWNSLIKTEAWINLRSVELVKRLTECHSLDDL